MEDYSNNGILEEHKHYTPYITCNNNNNIQGNCRVWLQVTGVDSSGCIITGNTVDNKQLQVKLNSPLSEPITGWIEVIGKMQGRMLLCNEFIVFPEETCKTVDVDGHRALTKLLTALDDPWNLGDDQHSNGH